MFGIDLTRSPHPKLIAIFSPLLSGGVFLIGCAYFRPELMDRFFANGSLDTTLRLIALVLLSYAAGIILSMAMAAPFLFVIYTSGYTLTRFLIHRFLSAKKSLPAPSTRMAFRRTASVLLGDAIVPEQPHEYSRELFEKMMGGFQRAYKVELPEPSKERMVELVEAELERTKAVFPHFEEQWADIYAALAELEQTKNNAFEKFAALEPGLSIASAIIVWRWLSFPTPPMLHGAAIVSLAMFGLAVFSGGVTHAFAHVNGTSVLPFLFEHLLDRSNDTKPKSGPMPAASKPPMN